MATISGTNGNDTNLLGTDADDIILALLGADSVNGLEGNDLIDAGEDDVGDNLFGAEGDDTFIGVGRFDTIDGGDGNDAIRTSLSNGDDLVVNDENDRVEVNDVSLTSVTNIEFIEVLNSSGTTLDLSQDAAFGFDVNLVSNETGTADEVSALYPMYFDADSGLVETSRGAETDTDLSEGLVINDTTYFVGQTYETAGGGQLFISDSIDFGRSKLDAVDFFALRYETGTELLLNVGDPDTDEDDILDEVIMLSVIDENGETITFEVTLTVNPDQDVDFSDSGLDVDESTRIDGTNQANVIIGNSGDDTLIGNGGNDSIEAGEGNDVLWAGKGDTGNDTVSGGEGDDIVGGGAGKDLLHGDEGNDSVYAGDGEDIARGFDGNDVVWSGAGDDSEASGGDGDDTVGGGLGGDLVMGDNRFVEEGAKDGDDVLYGGKDDGNDSLYGQGGDDTLYSGEGDDLAIGLSGNDLIYGGPGEDQIDGGKGNDTIWGGPGNDQLSGEDGDDTFAFAPGSGSDTLTDFELTPRFDEGVTGDVIDLTGLGFTSTQEVLDAINEVSGNAVLVLSPGNTVAFNGISVSDLASAQDDWVIV